LTNQRPQHEYEGLKNCCFVGLHIFGENCRTYSNPGKTQYGHGIVHIGEVNILQVKREAGEPYITPTKNVRGDKLWSALTYSDV
jgi:hypothetical protein